jgi:hypothetical protein
MLGGRSIARFWAGRLPHAARNAAQHAWACAAFTTDVCAVRRQRVTVGASCVATAQARIPNREVVASSPPVGHRHLATAALAGSATPVPEKPREPSAEECCGNDCRNCVWTEYWAKLQEYEAVVQASSTGLPTSEAAQSAPSAVARDTGTVELSAPAMLSIVGEASGAHTGGAVPGAPLAEAATPPAADGNTAPAVLSRATGS